MTIATLVLLALRPCFAQGERQPLADGLPEVDATLAPDGRFTLQLRSDVGWSQAELEVGDGPAILLGPAAAGAPVRVSGVTDSRGVLDVCLSAVDGTSRGVQWMFSVTPSEVPAAAPALVPPDGARRWWSRRGRQP